MSKAVTLPVGSLIILHQGEYSDKMASGPFRVLKPFNGDTLLAEFKAQWKPAHEWIEEPDADEFQAWLSVSGYLEDIEGVTHWHIGSYGRLETSDPWSGDGAMTDEVQK